MSVSLDRNSIRIALAHGYNVGIRIPLVWFRDKNEAMDFNSKSRRCKSTTPIAIVYRSSRHCCDIGCWLGELMRSAITNFSWKVSSNLACTVKSKWKYCVPNSKLRDTWRGCRASWKVEKCGSTRKIPQRLLRLLEYCKACEIHNCECYLEGQQFAAKGKWKSYVLNTKFRDTWRGYGALR